jgi:hypothetical protein
MTADLARFYRPEPWRAAGTLPRLLRRGRRPTALSSQALPRRALGAACTIWLARSSMRRMSAKVLARPICWTWQRR